MQGKVNTYLFGGNERAIQGTPEDYILVESTKVLYLFPPIQITTSNPLYCTDWAKLPTFQAQRCH